MPRRTLALICFGLLACSLPALADPPGPTIGGAVAVGQAHQQDGPRLDVRLQGWLPAALGPLRLGLEGAFVLEGEESGGSCHFGEPQTGDDRPSIGQACIESGLGARMLLGVEAGQRWIGRLEGGVGPVWRRAFDLRDGEGLDSRWSLSLVGRASGLLAVGDMLGGRWRVGVSLEAGSLDGEAPAYAGGLVFEAVVID